MRRENDETDRRSLGVGIENLPVVEFTDVSHTDLLAVLGDSSISNLGVGDDESTIESSRTVGLLLDLLLDFVFDGSGGLLLCLGGDRGGNDRGGGGDGGGVGLGLLGELLSLVLGEGRGHGIVTSELFGGNFVGGTLLGVTR